MSWLIVVGAAAAAVATGVLWLRRYVRVTVTGDSMTPTLYDGDRVLVRRTRPHRVRRGQIVVVARRTYGAEAPRAGTRWLVKRAVAVPGDPVPRTRVPVLWGVKDVTVPAGRLVVLGDNLPESHDSRAFGYVMPGALLGVAVRKLRRRDSP